MAMVLAQTEIACVASVSVWFRGKEKPRNGILGFGGARNETRAKKWKWGGGGGEGRKPSFLPHPLPALLFAPFFARSLTLVPRSLLLNRTETLATQAKTEIVQKLRKMAPHVVSNFTQRGFIATRFPEKIDDVSKMLHLLSSFKPMFFKTKSRKFRQNKYLPQFCNLFSLKFPQLHNSLSVTWGRYTTRKASLRESFSLSK